MGTPRPELPADSRDPSPGVLPVCPSTGVSIPECSCASCISEQIRLHAPDRFAELERAEQPRAA